MGLAATLTNLVILGLKDCFEKGALATQLDHVARGANRDLGFEGQLFRDRAADNGVADVLADNEGSDGTDVNDIEVGQVLRDLRRSAAVSASDVYSPEEYNARHEEVGSRSTK